MPNPLPQAAWTPNGWYPLHQIAAQTTHLELTGLDDKPFVARIHRRKVSRLLCVRIGYRTIEDDPDRRVLTDAGWKRLGDLRKGDKAVVRCGSHKAPPIVAGVQLGPKHRLRIVESCDGVSVALNGQPVDVIDFVTDLDTPYEINGVVVRNPDPVK